VGKVSDRILSATFRIEFIGMYNPIVRSNKIQSETSPKKSPFRGKIPEERQIQSRPILPNIKRSGPQAAAFVHRCAIFVWLEVLEGMISEFLLHPARQKKKSHYGYVMPAK
jgi:hypothetical protein